MPEATASRWDVGDEAMEPVVNRTPRLIPFGGHWVNPDEIAALTTSVERPAPQPNARSPKTRFYLHVVLRSGQRLSRSWEEDAWKRDGKALDARDRAMRELAAMLNALEGLDDETVGPEGTGQERETDG